MHAIPREDRQNVIKERRLTVVDPSTLGQLVTPVVIGIVSGVLSRLLYDFLKKESDRKKSDKSMDIEIRNHAIEIELSARA